MVWDFSAFKAISLIFNNSVQWDNVHFVYFCLQLYSQFVLLYNNSKIHQWSQV